jgi:hypothetical protein
METPTICNNYRIYHKNRIFMYVLARVGFYAITMKYLHYLCELFALFTQKTKPQFMCVRFIWGLGVGLEV